VTGESLRREHVPGFEPTVLSAPPLDLSGGRGRRSGGSSRRRQDTRSTRTYRR
ncbi:MAG: ATP-dependent RNA helicase RhlE, partial [Synechococcus sp. BS30m-G30]|nr:ATP-dependent RNA helicase RhlE [Synechococcus sp. BS30m-G30]